MAAGVRKGRSVRKTGDALAFLTFFDHNQLTWGRSAFVQQVRGCCFSGEGRLRAAIIEVHVAAKTVALSARPRSHSCVHRHCGTRSESRSGQIGPAVVCG
jgi:hypothetical protein